MSLDYTFLCIIIKYVQKMDEEAMNVLDKRSWLMHACQNNVKNIATEQVDSIVQNEPTADEIRKR